MPLNIIIISANESLKKELVNVLRTTSLKVQQIEPVSTIVGLRNTIKKTKEKIVFFDSNITKVKKRMFNQVQEAIKSAPIIILSNNGIALKCLEYLGSGAADILLTEYLTIFNVEKSITQALKNKSNADLLKFSNDRYRVVSKTTSDMVWDWDLRTNTLFRSETGWKKILGTDASSESIDPIYLVDPDSWRDRIHPADRAQCDKVIAGLLNNTTETNFDLQYRIKRNDHTYAFILDKGYVIRNEQGEPERLIGAATDYTEKRQLEQKIAKDKRIKQNEITRAVITAQEHEREEIGKELHDNINQLLATSKLYIEFSLSNPTAKTELLINAKNYIETAVKEIRLLTKALMPPSIGEDGLTMALQELVDSLKKINLFVMHTNWKQIKETLITEPLKLTIFRIVQEQLNNIIKHAKATEVWVLIQQTKKYITIEIKDDGVGFNAKMQKQGVGLKNIYSRAHLYNGEVKLKSAKQQGCSLMVQFKL